MNRQELRERFYQLTKSADARNAPPETVNLWLLEGNKKFCTDSFCLVDEYAINTVADVRSYDLLDVEPSYYDVDSNSGGVWYDGKSLLQTTQAQLSNERRNWRNNLRGTPGYWWTRKTVLSLDKNPEADKEIIVSIAKLPLALTQEDQYPFDGLEYLVSFHEALVSYAQTRFKMSQGKDQEKLLEKVDYQEYVDDAKKRVASNRSGSYALYPRQNMYQPSPRNRRNT